MDNLNFIKIYFKVFIYKIIVLLKILVQEVNQIDAYKSTKKDPKVTVETFLLLVVASVVLANKPII